MVFIKKQKKNEKKKKRIKKIYYLISKYANLYIIRIVFLFRFYLLMSFYSCIYFLSFLSSLWFWLIRLIIKWFFELVKNYLPSIFAFVDVIAASGLSGF